MSFTIIQFNYYPHETRAELVWDQGTFLAIRTEMGCSVVLYSLSGFFLEVWFSPDDNQVALVHGFDSRKLLKSYSDIINLEELMD